MRTRRRDDEVSRLRALDRINQVMLDGSRDSERRHLERDAAIAKAVMNGEAVILMGVRYIPAPEQSHNGEQLL